MTLGIITRWWVFDQFDDVHAPPAMRLRFLEYGGLDNRRSVAVPTQGKYNDESTVMILIFEC